MKTVIFHMEQGDTNLLFLEYIRSQGGEIYGEDFYLYRGNADYICISNYSVFDEYENEEISDLFKVFPNLISFAVNWNNNEHIGFFIEKLWSTLDNIMIDNTHTAFLFVKELRSMDKKSLISWLLGALSFPSSPI